MWFEKALWKAYSALNLSCDQLWLCDSAYLDLGLEPSVQDKHGKNLCVQYEKMESGGAYTDNKISRRFTIESCTITVDSLDSSLEPLKNSYNSFANKITQILQQNLFSNNLGEPKYSFTDHSHAIIYISWKTYVFRMISRF